MNKPGEEGETEEEKEMDSLKTIGCTANVVMLDYELKKIFVANAGDSRCVMGKAGKAVPLSFDHKPDDDIEIKRIEAAGSAIIDGRVDGNLNLTRALGDLKHKEKENLKPEEQPITANPDVYEYPLEDDIDFILMGCDGIWEQFDNDQMVEWVYKRLGDKPLDADLAEVTKDLLHSQISPDIQ